MIIIFEADKSNCGIGIDHYDFVFGIRLFFIAIHVMMGTKMSDIMREV